MRSRLVRLFGVCCVLFGLFFASVSASALPSQLSILVDADADLGTGCSVATPEGAFAGVDERVDVTVESFGDGTAEVQSVLRRSCTGGSFGPPVVVDDTGWPVGIGLGEAGRNVVEAYAALADLGAGPDLRLGVLHVAGAEADALLETSPGSGLPIVLVSVADLQEIPTLSEWAALLLALLLIAAALRALRRRQAVLLVLLCVAASVAGTVWAACVMDGLVDDWTAADQLAEDSLGEASPSVDLAAFFAKIEDGILCLRIDTDLQFNQAPTASAKAASTPEDTLTLLSLTGSDPDGDTLTFSVTAAPSNGTLGAVTPTGPASAQVTYSPSANYSGLDAFTFQVADGFGGVDTAVVTLTVTPANDPPTAASQAVSTAEDTPIVVTLIGADIDGDALDFAIATGPTSGSLGAVTPVGPTSAQVTYTPNLDVNGADGFTFTSSDGLLTSAPATVSITVTASDDPPVAVDDAASVTEDDPATPINVLANDTDPDGGPISITATSDPAAGTVVVTGGGTGLTYQPDPDACNLPPGGSPDTFTYTLAPGGSTATVSVTVTCVDDSPVAVDDAATVTEDDPATAIPVLANDTDLDGGAISIVATSDPAAGTVVITGGTGLTYQPEPNLCNDPPGTTPDTFTYTLAPGGSTATVSMTVTCVDDPPLAVDDTATVLEDAAATAIDVLLNDVDLDGGPKGVTSVTQPTNGAVVITGGGALVTYQPNADTCNDPPGGAPDTFTYTLTPGATVATVSVTVTCVDDPPGIDLDADDDQGTAGTGFAVTFTEGDAATLLEDPADATITDIDDATLASLTVTLTNLLDAGAETLSVDGVTLAGTSITADYDTTTDPAQGVLTLTGPDTLPNFIAVLRTVAYQNTDENPDATER